MENKEPKQKKWYEQDQATVQQSSLPPQSRPVKTDEQIQAMLDREAEMDKMRSYEVAAFIAANSLCKDAMPLDVDNYTAKVKNIQELEARGFNKEGTLDQKLTDMYKKFSNHTVLTLPSAPVGRLTADHLEILRQRNGIIEEYNTLYAQKKDKVLADIDTDMVNLEISAWCPKKEDPTKPCAVEHAAVVPEDKGEKSFKERLTALLVRLPKGTEDAVKTWLEEAASGVIPHNLGQQNAQLLCDTYLLARDTTILGKAVGDTHSQGAAQTNLQSEAHGSTAFMLNGDGQKAELYIYDAGISDAVVRGMIGAYKGNPITVQKPLDGDKHLYLLSGVDDIKALHAHLEKNKPLALETTQVARANTQQSLDNAQLFLGR